MKIREYIETDYERVKEFTERNGLSFPAEGKMLIAEDDNGEIKSICGVRYVLFIEPSISGHPVYGKKLFDHIEKKIKEDGVPIEVQNKIDNKCIEE